MRIKRKGSIRITVTTVVSFFSSIGYGRTQSVVTEQMIELPRIEAIRQVSSVVDSAMLQGIVR